MTLRQARQAKGLTTTQLAALVGVSEGSIRAYERGVRFPNHSRAILIERVLGADPGEIEWPPDPRVTEVDPVQLLPASGED